MSTKLNQLQQPISKQLRSPTLLLKLFKILHNGLRNLYQQIVNLLIGIALNQLRKTTGYKTLRPPSGLEENPRPSHPHQQKDKQKFQIAKCLDCLGKLVNKL